MCNLHYIRDVIMLLCLVILANVLQHQKSTVRSNDIKVKDNQRVLVSPWRIITGWIYSTTVHYHMNTRSSHWEKKLLFMELFSERFFGESKMVLLWFFLLQNPLWNLFLRVEKCSWFLSKEKNCFIFFPLTRVHCS